MPSNFIMTLAICLMVVSQSAYSHPISERLEKPDPHIVNLQTLLRHPEIRGQFGTTAVPDETHDLLLSLNPSLSAHAQFLRLGTELWPDGDHEKFTATLNDALQSSNPGHIFHAATLLEAFHRAEPLARPVLGQFMLETLPAVAAQQLGETEMDLALHMSHLFTLFDGKTGRAAERFGHLLLELCPNVPHRSNIVPAGSEKTRVQVVRGISAGLTTPGNRSDGMIIPAHHSFIPPAAVSSSWRDGPTHDALNRLLGKNYLGPLVRNLRIRGGMPVVLRDDIPRHQGVFNDLLLFFPNFDAGLMYQQAISAALQEAARYGWKTVLFPFDPQRNLSGPLSDIAGGIKLFLDEYPQSLERITVLLEARK